MPTPSEGYVLATRAFSVIIIGFGLVIVIRTLTAGGGALSFGLLIGLVFVGMGAARLYLAIRGARP
jgi:hypothetical protein